MVTEKVALITGISSGIGRAIGTLLSDRGYQVYGTARRPKTDAEFEKIKIVALDVRDDESVTRCLEQVLDEAGKIDALVNNAGYTLTGSLEETSMEEAKALFETNFFGVLRMNQAVLPIMRKQGHGRIINIGSVTGFLAAPYQGIYAASKHAVEGYSESLDHEVRRFGIRVSVVEPGYIRTPIVQNSQQADKRISAYAMERDLAMDAILKSNAAGEDPIKVAKVVLEALTSRSPRLRYLAGRQAKVTHALKKFLPERLFDKGLRKQFGLTAA